MTRNEIFEGLKEILSAADSGNKALISISSQLRPIFVLLLRFSIVIFNYTFGFSAAKL